MNEQMAQAKFLKFIADLRKGNARHASCADEDATTQPTANVSIGDVLDAFLQADSSCKPFRDHLVSVSLKYAKIIVVEESWKCVNESLAGG